MIIIDQTQFLANLRLTQAYCQHHAEHKEKVEWTGLRNIINPVYEDGEWFIHMPGLLNEEPISWYEWAKQSDPYYHDSFVELFRRQMQLKQSVADELNHDSTFLGKILVVEYGLNIPDGAVEVDTEGFFDEWDLLPIDTWFYNDYSVKQGGTLFAWIPEKFIELVDKAIAVQFLDILHWFKSPPKWSPYRFSLV